MVLINRRKSIRRLVLSALLAFVAAGASAAPERFSEARFKTLQGEGALIMVDVHADWCPTCAKQQKILDDYQAARPAVALHRLLVDFDGQKDWVKHFKAPRQSTLLLYRGAEQQWFSVAETRMEEIFKAIDAAAGVQP